MPQPTPESDGAESVRSGPPGLAILGVAGMVALLVLGLLLAVASDAPDDEAVDTTVARVEPTPVPQTSSPQTPLPQTLVIDPELFDLDSRRCAYGPLLITRPANWTLGSTCESTTHAVHARFSTTFSDNGVNAAWDSQPVAEVEYRVLDPDEVVAHRSGLLLGRTTSVAGRDATRHEAVAVPRQCADCTDGFGVEYLVDLSGDAAISIRLTLGTGRLIDRSVQRDTVTQFDAVVNSAVSSMPTPRTPFPGESGSN